MIFLNLLKRNEMMILRSRKGFFMLKNCMILTQERSKKYGKDNKRHDNQRYHKRKHGLYSNPLK